jgi:hypothetical protein
VRLMELVVSRENMMAAYARVVGNKGAAGIDAMSVADLKPFGSCRRRRPGPPCCRCPTTRFSTMHRMSRHAPCRSGTNAVPSSAGAMADCRLCSALQ